MKIRPLDMRDISIIDAFPVYRCSNIVLNVGCGEGRLDYHLVAIKYLVYSTDIVKPKSEFIQSLNFFRSDIFDLKSFPVRKASIVICSQVLEHLKQYKIAVKNLLILTDIRLIMTVPMKKSFYSPDHCNFWDDVTIREFEDLCSPYSVSISKIRTKPEDIKKNYYDYLIVVDRRQNG